MNKRILYIGNMLTDFGYTPTGIDFLGKLFVDNGYKVLFASDKKNKIVRLLSIIKRIISYRNHYDIIIIDTYSAIAFYYSLITAWVARLLNKPYIPILRGGNLPNRLKRSPWLIKQVIMPAFRVVSVSQYLQQVFAALRPIEYIPNFINLPKYPFKQRTTFSLRLLWVRSFHTIYNPKLAVEIVAVLKRDYPTISLTMVGPDKDGSRAAVESLAEQLGVRENIEITGKLSKEAWIELAFHHDIFINTTNFDNMPVSVIEVMALGLPVVSTNVGGIPYLIENGVDGLLVDKNDCDGFCKSITRIIQQTDLSKQICTTARKKAETFDSEAIAKQWILIFNEII